MLVSWQSGKRGVPGEAGIGTDQTVGQRLQDQCIIRGRTDGTGAIGCVVLLRPNNMAISNS